MTIPVVLSCPLGHKCEELKDGAIHRCNWFIELQGTNPNNGESVNERGCAMAWLPILLIENAGATRSASAAVESLRNEVVMGNGLPPFPLIGGHKS